MKIFLTVGSMLPFDRLVAAVDKWAEGQQKIEVFGQIGRTTSYPKNINFSTMISPSEYRSHIINSDLIISHVGMGTVIAAIEHNKPLILLPRRSELHEVTSNHQLETAQWLKNKPGIYIIDSEKEVAGMIAHNIESMVVPQMKIPAARNDLINGIRQFILNPNNV
ncbi:glycosyltransferase [Nitrosovibrio sp. Nv17]|uniref:glycosyltransferase n=1 Tax=Nitrosovibrio sp. Nv17 TaxID=1855339 RepID=UPI000A683663|nr:glycosyltransferase [Nitrosovibrio sp. Nv17]